MNNPHYDDIFKCDHFSGKCVKMERFGGVIRLYIELPAGVVDTWRKWLKRSTQVNEFPELEAIGSFVMDFKQDGKSLCLFGTMINGKRRRRGPTLDFSLYQKGSHEPIAVGNATYDRERGMHEGTITDFSGAVTTHEIYFVKGKL